MIRIGICDDIASQRKSIQQMCDGYFKGAYMEHDYVNFSSGEEVLNYDGEMLHLLFLDIEMGNKDGITVMKELLAKKTVWRIVFVSAHQDAVWDSFSLKTLGFVRKPVAYKDIHKWLAVMIRECKKNITIAFEPGNKDTYVTMDSLIYLAAERNYVRVVTDKSTFLISGNLKEWERQLCNTPMVRVHKSYLVNLQYITLLGTDIVLKEHKGTIPIGRKFRMIVKEQYNEFLLEQIRGRL